MHCHHSMSASNAARRWGLRILHAFIILSMLLPGAAANP